MKIDSLVKNYGALPKVEQFNKEIIMDDKQQVIHSSFWTNFFTSNTDETNLREALLSLPIFKELNKRDCSLLLNIIHNRIYVAGEYIFYQGDPGLGMYLIREGEVEIKRENSDKSIHLLATLKKGDFFGELALVDGEKRSASAIASSDTKLAVIFKPDLEEYIERLPKKGIKIMRGISEIIAMRLRKVNEELSQQ